MAAIRIKIVQHAGFPGAGMEARGCTACCVCPYTRVKRESVRTRVASPLERFANGALGRHECRLASGVGRRVGKRDFNSAVSC